MIYHRNSGDGYVPNLDGLQDEIDTAVHMLKDATFDGIVVRGMSGVVPGVPVALALGKPLAILRKPDEDRHAHEAWINESKITPDSTWLFLDDFVSGGSTREAVVSAIASKGARVVSQYMTRDCEIRRVDEDGYDVCPWEDDDAAELAEFLLDAETQEPSGISVNEFASLFDNAQRALAEALANARSAERDTPDTDHSFPF